MLLELYWWDSSKFSLAVTSVITTCLVGFSATNMHTYHKVAIVHLMQAWARIAPQCFSLYLWSCSLTARHLAPSPSFLSVFPAVCICELPIWRLVSELHGCRAGQEWRGDDLCCSGSSGSHGTHGPATSGRTTCSLRRYAELTFNITTISHLQCT